MLAVTGHRPEKLLGYGAPAFLHLTRFASSQLRSVKPQTVITGMALGWDQAVAEACCQLGIPFIAAVPFAGQERRWQDPDQKRYTDLLRCAKRVEVTAKGGYEAWKMQRRNQWMVQQCKELLALWDGSAGGTANCVRYATARKVPIIDCWDEWLKFKKEHRL